MHSKKLDVVDQWLHSKDKFPVDFDRLWPMLHQNKKKAITFFKHVSRSNGWTRGIDYEFSSKNYPKRFNVAAYRLTLRSLGQYAKAYRVSPGDLLLNKITTKP